MPIFNQVVAGGGSTPTCYIEKTVDANGVLKSGTNIIDLSGVKDVEQHQLAFAYYNQPSVTGSVNLSSLTKVTGESAFDNAFYNCTGITGVIDLGLLTVVGGPYAFRNAFNGNGITGVNLSSLNTAGVASAFYGTFMNCSEIIGNVNVSSLKEILQTSAFAQTFKNCIKITSVDFGSLEKVGANGCNELCSGCTSLINANFDNLKQITNSSGFGGVFIGCTSLPTFRFCSLNSIGAQSALTSCFKNCTALQSLWFYALGTNSFGSRTNQFNGMLYGVTGCTVHFPMAIQSTIGSWMDVTNGFSGTNTTVLFDIVTTLTGADSNTYTRQEKDSTSTATAWVYNDTLYYTSGVSDNANGVNEPSVSDAIYSDAACTQSVTTITAIA